MKTNYLLLLSIIFLFSCSPKAESNQMETASVSAVSDETPTSGKKLRHVVLFKFKESATAEDIAKVEKAFSELPAKIPEIKGFEWGINNSPEGLDKGYTHCFLLTFDDEEGRAVYLPHPDHKAFGSVVGPVLEDVHVIDYWTGE